MIGGCRCALIVGSDWLVSPCLGANWTNMTNHHQTSYQTRSRYQIQGLALEMKVLLVVRVPGLQLRSFEFTPPCGDPYISSKPQI